MTESRSAVGDGDGGSACLDHEGRVTARAPSLDAVLWISGPGGPYRASRIEVADLARIERDRVRHVAAAHLLVKGAGLALGIELFVFGAIARQRQRVCESHVEIVDAKQPPVPGRPRWPVDTVPLYHRAVPGRIEVRIGEREGLDEAVLGIEDGHPPVAGIRDPKPPIVIQHETVRVHELAGSLPLAAVGRDVSAVRAEDAEFLRLRIEDGEAPILQHDKALQVCERVRSGPFNGADPKFLDQRPGGGDIRHRDVRDADRARRQGVPYRGPVGLRRGVAAAGQGHPRHGEQGASFFSMHHSTPL